MKMVMLILHGRGKLLKLALIPIQLSAIHMSAIILSINLSYKRDQNTSGVTGV
jgi:hypothetical protein